MSGFRAGGISRDRVPRGLRHFSPHEALASLGDVDLAALKSQGKTLILLDVDNTLIPWRGYEFPAETLQWVARAKELGFRLCLISNTRHPERLTRLSEKLDVGYVRDKFKPSRAMYLSALRVFDAQASEAVMLGDQLLTDILGANRAGIDAYWIKPMGKREFIGTRLLSRNVERVVGRLLYRYFQDTVPRAGLFHHAIVGQFVKFAVVGGLSTVVDLGLHGMLMFAPLFQGEPASAHIGRWMMEMWHPADPMTAKAVSDAAYAPLKVPTAILAILNSYFWNRRWTFKVDSEVGHARLVTRFFIVAAIGVVLNAVIGSSVNRLLDRPPTESWAGASIVSTLIVVFWNFCGQRYFTFRGHGK